MTGVIVVTVAILLLAGGCTTKPAPSTEEVVAAGDIASCRSEGDEATAELVEGIDGTVLALGDEAYPRGSAANFEECYEPSWGRFKERTRPVPGNHEYFTEGASGYFEYFGEAAGDSEGSILQFVVGTRGAAENYTIGDPMENTEIYNDETDGVLRLKLEDNAHEWRFVPVAGESVTDSGSAGCH